MRMKEVPWSVETEKRPGKNLVVGPTDLGVVSNFHTFEAFIRAVHSLWVGC